MQEGQIPALGIEGCARNTQKGDSAGLRGHDRNQHQQPVHLAVSHDWGEEVADFLAQRKTFLLYEE